MNGTLLGGVGLGGSGTMAPGSARALGLRSIRHAFGRTRVLDGIDLDVRGGEFLSLLGPSGCGKTTLLRIVAGLEELQKGTIDLDGQNLAALPTERRSLGMVFQSYALFPNLDVRNNVAYGLRSRSVAREDVLRRVAAMLDRVGLTGLERRYPAELSGGQQQRVALARALVMSPRILLLDEPFSALDAKVREETRLLVRSLQRETGICAILVTHDQEEALTISDRIALMQGGRLVQVDTPRDIYRKPSTLFAADFLGTANRFRGDEAAKLDPSSSGAVDVEAVVRPEDLVVAEAGIEATIDDLEFRGSVLRLVTRAADDRIWFCDIDARDEHHYALGQEVRLRARRGCVLCYVDGRIVA